MATPVKLPALGESVTEGTVTRWLKQPGDSVEVDEALLEVSTDKVDTEIPSPVAGTLLEIKVNEDETVEVGAELATIGDASESGADSDEESSDGSDEASSDSDGDSGEELAEQEPAEQEAPEEQASADEQVSDGSSTAGSQDTDESPSDDDARSDDDSQSDDEPQSDDESQEPPAAGTKQASGEGTSVTLPALGESVTEGTVTRWLKQPGDSVEVDEALLEV
ncbi:MAG: 2-oxoglutarate dehydrogenase, E2 component, dihydrolipoamide succinyltransferase, partial [Nocardioidaceae bacterium]|nr:2-oxoglutarate dehydrogenase, E2 component, dihydrolipoamide succinyltransferase [Nocardioidaceae bacterium]